MKAGRAESSVTDSGMNSATSAAESSTDHAMAQAATVLVTGSAAGVTATCVAVSSTPRRPVSAAPTAAITWACGTVVTGKRKADESRWVTRGIRLHRLQ
ncbi:hypothetical protein BN975_02601 [Mycolicibacterium farcinogenes]|nr:hypothetical protein BN975_02601 [Mycolicibacterium farcinogenes]